MKFPHLYRSVLKQISAVAHAHPHHLQDIRFILSYPPAPSVAHPTDMARLCCDDLRRAILSHSSASSVAERFIQLRALSWLHNRLAAAMSPATESILQDARSVASALGEDDFLTDEMITGGTARPLPAEGDGVPAAGAVENGVASAGELGARREIFILHHTSTLSLPVAYLSAFGADESAIATAALSSSRLIEYVTHHITRRVTCCNNDLELTVTVRPFDPVVSKQHAVEGDPFALVNRYFVVHFEMKPHDPSYQVNVVNSYFLRFDVGSSELIEDVGYIHPSHVWKYAQSVLKQGEAIREEDEPVSPTFELMFVNPDDTPVVMKGQLHYIICDKDSDKLTQMSARVILFGQLLLLHEV